MGVEGMITDAHRRRCRQIAKYLTARQAYAFWVAMRSIAKKICKPIQVNGQTKTIEDIPQECFELYLHNCAVEAIRAGKEGASAEPPECLDARLLLNKFAESQNINYCKTFLRLRKRV
jgi:hypothetical protein